ncbi:Cytochrome c oxidase assembly protein Surf1 [Roseomonas mucosa]|nr:Cytochrome c oxidase assembly protein Surf1 [Roseomonas mucosa]GAV34097.1 SURF1 family protein [Roseomonas sp. TAS13]
MAGRRVVERAGISRLNLKRLMTRFRRLLIPLLCVLPVLVVLVELGNWQVRRLHWKTDILARVDAAEAGPPRVLRDPPEELSRVVATGRFLHDREALVGLEVRNAVLGAFLVTPLERADGPPVLVNRGWVPLERRAPVGHPEGVVSVTGWVRPADGHSLFAASDDPAGRRFYTFDPAVIGPALGLPRVAPYALVALAAPSAAPSSSGTGPAPGGQANGNAPSLPGGLPGVAAGLAPATPSGAAPVGSLPQPARAMPRPGNPHLGYAITWYGTALALAGVFAAFAWRRLKDPA